MVQVQYVIIQKLILDYSLDNTPVTCIMAKTKIGNVVRIYLFGMNSDDSPLLPLFILLMGHNSKCISESSKSSV